MDYVRQYLKYTAEVDLGGRIASGIRASGTGRTPGGNQRCLFAMKIKYFQETDSLHIEFNPVDITETRDLDENTLLDLDRDENICAMTIEHAKGRTDVPHFSYEHVSE